MKPETTAQKVARGYLKAALWTATRPDGAAVQETHSLVDFDARAWRDAAREVSRFIAAPGVAEALTRADEFPTDYRAESLGVDLWLSRNGGRGFAGRHGLPVDVKDVLTRAALDLGGMKVAIGEQLSILPG